MHAFGESHSENNLVEFVPLSICKAYLITENFFPGSAMSLTQYWNFKDRLVLK